ncbi:MAG TPA: pilus assembly protein PilM [Candidatus Paceibacterota bacterium]|jgi:type IV pilus assembly protein PilM|nr:pilus assembly protein PilM [Candidatus Paceibacterota bacterium]
MLTRLFPAPSAITLPAVGLDFSDSTMRFVKLKETVHGFLPEKFSELAIPEGCMQGGRIIDEGKWIEFLKQVRTTHKLKYVRVAMPESQTYSFVLTLDPAAAQDIRSAIELVLEDNIPLKAPETVFDYHIITQTDTAIIVQVLAVAEMTTQNYCNSFLTAGLVPVSFELDGQATARAVIKPHDNNSYMVVDFGAHRTGITIITHNTAVFTSTVEFGGKALIAILQKGLNISEEEAQHLKREYGLSAIGEHKDIFDLLVGGVSTLKDEINRRYVYWHERKEQYGAFPNIETIYLTGGHSNLAGLADYLSVSLRLSVVQVNPWINCVSFEDEIPEMSYEESMSYVTAIGLALADYYHD